MKKYFIIIISLTLILYIFSDSLSVDYSKAKLIELPFDSSIDENELLKINIEKNKAYKITGYFMVFRYKNKKISGKRFNPSGGNVYFYDTYNKTDELVIKGLKKSKIKIISGFMKEKILKEGESLTYKCKKNKKTAAYFYNMSDDESLIEYDFLKDNISISKAPLKWRTYKLNNKENKYYIWDVNTEEIIIYARKGKISIKIGQPFNDI